MKKKQEEADAHQFCFSLSHRLRFESRQKFLDAAQKHRKSSTGSEGLTGGEFS